MSHLFLSRLHDERGSVLVTAGVMVLAFLLLGAVVIEVGQWFEHRRALQARTDASALAAGQALNACFNIGTTAFPNETAADNYIESWAQNYGGISSTASTQTSSPYNHQFGKGSTYMSFQSDTYPSAGTPQPAKNLGYECFKDGNPTNTAASNVNLMEDVKTTQSGIPPLFSISPFATVHGHARIQLQTIKSFKPSLPLAVPDIQPAHVAVTFVDNATGAKIAGPFPLDCTRSPTTGLCIPTGTLNYWSGTTTAITMPAANTNVGMRVSIGSQNGDCSGNINATSTYLCYDYSTTGSADPNGILAIRSYNGGGTGSQTAPILRSVTPHTCDRATGTSPYFSTYQATQSLYTGTCPAYVTAVVDFGGYSPQEEVRGALKASSGGSTTLTFPDPGSGDTWQSDAVDLPTGQGPYTVTLQWRIGNSGSWNNFNSGNAVQQIFSGSDGSDPTAPGGPIMEATIYDSSNAAPYSEPAGQSETFTVTLALSGGVHVNPKCTPPPDPGSGSGYTCASDPTVLLKTTNSNASLTYAIDCGTVPGHTGGTLYQQIAYGCANYYSINTADVCPDPANPTPTSCASVQTGVAAGQTTQGLTQRLVTSQPGGVCAPNYYPDTAEPNDPRVVQLIVTDFSAYVGSGGTTKVPVITYASFYITGWYKAPSSCNTENEPIPVAGGGTSGDVWGHFITYVTGGGTPSGLTCKPTSVAPCVAALVR